MYITWRYKDEYCTPGDGGGVQNPSLGGGGTGVSLYAGDKDNEGRHQSTPVWWQRLYRHDLVMSSINTEAEKQAAS